MVETEDGPVDNGNVMMLYQVDFRDGLGTTVSLQMTVGGDWDAVDLTGLTPVAIVGDAEAYLTEGPVSLRLIWRLPNGSLMQIVSRGEFSRSAALAYAAQIMDEIGRV